MGDVEDFREVGVRVSLFGYREEACVAHDMGVRHDAFAINNKSRAYS